MGAGGGKAPGDMVSGMRPPLPIDPGANCAMADPLTAVTAKRAKRRGMVRMVRIWKLRMRPQVHP